MARFPTFRYFWDYAGGAMTDWGVHLIDPVHQCYGEPMPMFGHGAATSIHGTEGTLVVNRGGCYVTPNEKSAIAPVTFEKDRGMSEMNVPHWKNFIECVRTRAKPVSDIETCVRSSTPCILANLSMRHRTWLDWDEANWTVKQEHIRPFLKAKYREPWTLEV